MLNPTGPPTRPALTTETIGIMPIAANPERVPARLQQLTNRRRAIIPLLSRWSSSIAGCADD